MTESSRLSFRKLVLLDALTCFVMGVALLTLGRFVADVTRLPIELVFWAGASLMPIAIFMAATGWLNRAPKWAAWIVVIGNAGWVLASLAILLFGIVSPNVAGWVFMIGQAAVVAVMTKLESTALSTESNVLEEREGV